MARSGETRGPPPSESIVERYCSPLRRFVEDAGYVTEAERFGWSFVFQAALSPKFPSFGPILSRGLKPPRKRAAD
jgi:hypothetical protein